MTQPDFLNTTICPYSYTQSAGITDVATVITDIRTALVTGLSWTEPTAALFRCPNNAGGQWFDMLLTKITATSLEMRIRNQFGQTICTRRVSSDATTTWNYFCGKFYCIIECLRATPELLQTFIVDPSPDVSGDFRNCILATGLRSVADVNDGGGAAVGAFFAWENTAAISKATHLLCPTIDTSNVTVARTTGSGALLCEDANTGFGDSSWAGSVPRYYGRMWQAYVIDGSTPFATDKTIMVDDASSAVFRVIGLTEIFSSRIAIRKSG